jgi:hypothetical protein
MNKIFGGIVVLAIAAVAAFNVNMNTQKGELSDLSLANVEALAQGEGGSTFYCPGGANECARVYVGTNVYIYYQGVPKR